MTAPIEELGLCKAARLEPSELLCDPSAFEKQVPPFRVVFFFGNKHDRVQHMSPLLGILGMSFKKWAIDTLHSLHMGPFSTAVSFTLQKMLESPVWKPAILGLDQNESSKLALCGLKSELWQFYKDMRNNKEWKDLCSEACNQR